MSQQLLRGRSLHRRTAHLAERGMRRMTVVVRSSGTDRLRATVAPDSALRDREVPTGHTWDSTPFVKRLCFNTKRRRDSSQGENLPTTALASRGWMVLRPLTVIKDQLGTIVLSPNSFNCGEPLQLRHDTRLHHLSRAIEGTTSTAARTIKRRLTTRTREQGFRGSPAARRRFLTLDRMIGVSPFL